MEKQTLELFLKEKKNVLKLRAIEKELGLPDRTFNNVVTGQRNVPDKYREITLEYFKNLGKNIV